MLGCRLPLKDEFHPKGALQIGGGTRRRTAHLRGKRLPPGRLCVWVLEMLEFNEIYLRSEPLVKRRQRLERLMHNADASGPIRLSETFNDPERLGHVHHWV